MNDRGRVTTVCSRDFENYHILLQIREENTVDGIKSTLVVRDARPDQFGTYNCTVSNDYGTDAIEISLRPQSKYLRVNRLF